MSNKFPATLVHILDDETKVIINRGSEDGINKGDRFLIYSVGEELFDPETNESLGKLEIVKGTGKVIHVQPRLATIESDRLSSPNKTITKKKSPFIASSSFEEEVISGEREILPFEDPTRGDKAKPI
ncbi:hypothetical protein BK726_27430 [Bacillus thuringiensis serovar londrina]|uniref:hypothetical protein n=1 Tax=Bacillus thuringiensis TaxID=1428 RepID=UPI000B449BF8|nr:hypothetical protein [Bacillus thuringiensis]OTX80807.1 hypothetical protein BK726_27430 [Bacillus thuringiensis serovar londrina]